VVTVEGEKALGKKTIGMDISPSRGENSILLQGGVTEITTEDNQKIKRHLSPCQEEEARRKRARRKKDIRPVLSLHLSRRGGGPHWGSDQRKDKKAKKT